MNYIKAVFFGCLFFSVTVLAGYGAYSYVYYDDLLIECTEKAYKNGYQTGFFSGKENVETVLRHEYQNIIARLSEEKYDSKDIRQQITMERRLDKIMMKSNSKLSPQKRNLWFLLVVVFGFFGPTMWPLSSPTREGTLPPAVEKRNPKKEAHMVPWPRTCREPGARTGDSTE